MSRFKRRPSSFKKKPYENARTKYHRPKKHVFSNSSRKYSKKTELSSNEGESSAPKPSLPKQKIPNIIKYEGFTYKYGNFSDPNLEIVVREAKKYTHKGMDIHIKEIEGRLYLYYRKVPADMDYIEDPNHPAAKGGPAPDYSHDESKVTRKDWNNHNINPYWLNGISRSKYIKSSSSNAPLYTEDDFICDPSSGEIRSEYGWKTLKEFPKISDIHPDALRSWVKGSLSTAGAMRQTRIKNEVEESLADDEDEREEEVEREDEVEEMDEDDDIDEEPLLDKHKLEKEDRLPSKEHLRGRPKKPVFGAAGTLIKSAASGAKKSLKDYAEWVEEKNRKAYEGGEGSLSKKSISSGPSPEEKHEAFERSLEMSEQRFNNARMAILGGGPSRSNTPPSDEDLEKSQQRFNNARMAMLGGGVPRKNPTTAEEDYKRSQQRFDSARAAIMFGGVSSRPPAPSQQASPPPQQHRRDPASYENAARSLMFGLSRPQPNQPYVRPPPTPPPVPSQTAQINNDLKRAKQRRSSQKNQNMMAEQAKARQEGLNNTRNNLLSGKSLLASQKSPSVQQHGKPQNSQKKQGPKPSYNDTRNDILYGTHF